MKLHALGMKGIGRYRASVTLPIGDLGNAEVVAITGRNGCGKTTLIEGVPGLLYGWLPSRGLVAGVANARDSYIEGVIETDQIYRMVRKINAVRTSPKTEAYIFDSSGNALNDGKQSTFDAEVAKRFPSQRIYLASGFASQKRGGQFLEVARSERKVLFAEMLGLGRLQTMAEAAGQCATTINEELVKLGAEAAARRTPEKEIAEEALAQTRGHRDKVIEQIRVAEDQLRESQTALEIWRNEMIDLERVFGDAKSDAEKAIGARNRIADNAARLDDRLSEVTTEWERIRSRLAERGELERIVAQAMRDGRLDELESEIEELRAARERDAQALADWREQLNAAQRDLDTAESSQARALERAHVARDRARDHLLNLETAAAGLGDVPCGGEGAYSDCPLITAATQARDQLECARAEAVRLAEVATETEKGLGAAHVDAAASALRVVEGRRPSDPDTTRLPDLEAELRSRRQMELKITEARAKLEAIAEAESRAAELEQEAWRLRTELCAVRAALGDADGSVTEADRALASAREAWKIHRGNQPEAPTDHYLLLWERELSELDRKIAKYEEAIRIAEEAAKALQKIEAEISVKTIDLDDWRHLQKALGRDGIQALEVDAAGPEISDLINDLLHSCFDSRFSGALETTALKADGRGTKEIFDLRVIDSEMGTDGSASELSGGERVIVAEALSLAICIYNTRRSSIPIQDLFRDECAGALDYVRAPLYVTMLRKAIELGNFHRVYFITHQRELWDLADTQIRVEDGACRVA